MGLFAFNRMRRERAQKAEKEVVVRTANDYTKQEIIDMNAKEQRAFIEQHTLAIEGYKSMKAPALKTALLAHLGLTEANGEGEADANTND